MRIKSQIESRNIGLAGTGRPKRTTVGFECKAGPAVFPRLVVGSNQSGIPVKPRDHTDVRYQNAAIGKRLDLLYSSGVGELGQIKIREGLAGANIESLNVGRPADVIQDATIGTKSQESCGRLLCVPSCEKYEGKTNDSQPAQDFELRDHCTSVYFMQLSNGHAMTNMLDCAKL